MNKQDWLDYFEAINGRTPSQEEVQQALINGEFLDEVEAPVVSESVKDIPEPVISEPTQVQPQPATQTMPKPPVAPQPVYQQPVAPQQQAAYVGQQQVPTGHPQQTPPVAFSQNQQGQQDVYNVQVAVPSAYSNFLKQFWAWLVSAWKAPTSVFPTHKYNGYFALFLLTFFASMTTYIASSKAYSGVISLMGELSSLTGGYYGQGLDLGFFFKTFLAFAFIFFSIIFAGFVARRFVYQEKSLNLASSFERYGRLFSVSILLFVISSLLVMLNVFSLASLVLAINFFFLSGASAFALANFDNKNTLDKFYQYLLAMLVNAVIIIIFVYIGLSVAGESIMNGLL
ncbi:uncharacterized membrane protein YidH (DUF202 family) [Streptococcus rupicaprae]|uniref:Uncharacterized membrane protein YidH (DUF202 family) n=1 Tax=Streptococcus rupicaprae TaxID=759619 RepID=A0ABV2FK44_9STRE